MVKKSLSPDLCRFAYRNKEDYVDKEENIRDRVNPHGGSWVSKIVFLGLQ